MPRNGPYSSNQYLSHSKLQSPLTIKWLNEHYEVAQGVSLPRSSLYAHYLDFCQTSGINPVNAASFGKIIRHNFPNLKTRRLGTRGQSKYHYYGITIKESSPYYDTLLNIGRQPTQSNTSTKPGESSARNQTCSPAKSSHQQHCLMSSSGGTLLPLFPKSDTLNLPPTVSQDKVRTFLIMYRAHCQRILDTILRANFGEVQKFLIHFWQGMPEHILTILNCPEVIDLVGVCDSILFKAIGSVLIPGVLQPLPASLTQAIRQFATQLSSWLESSLTHFPEKLKEKKLEVARSFSKSLRRKTSLTHLAQAARTVLHSAEPVAQMMNDWQEIDFNEIIKQTLWTFSSNPEADCKTIEAFLRDFSELLEQQATIDQYAGWASNLVDTCVKKLVDEDDVKCHECSRQFLLKWSFFGNQVMRELTLKSAQSFGSFHLLHILLEDYIVYYVECKVFPKTKENESDNKVTNSEQCDSVHEDIELQEESDIEIVGESSCSSQANIPITLQSTSKKTDACPSSYRQQTRPPPLSVVPRSEYQPDTPTLISDSSPSPSGDYQTYSYFRTTESHMHSYLAPRGYNTTPPYSVVSGQNIVYSGIYSPISDVRSPTDLKSYDQYAVQDNPSYTSRYLSQAVVPAGNPLYTRNFYHANNEYHDNHQAAYDHRLHSRLLGETY